MGPEGWLPLRTRVVLVVLCGVAVTAVVAVAVTVSWAAAAHGDLLAAAADERY